MPFTPPTPDALVDTGFTPPSPNSLLTQEAPKQPGFLERFSRAAAEADTAPTAAGLEEMPESHMAISLPRAGFTPQPDDAEPIGNIFGVPETISASMTKGTARKAGAILANAGLSAGEATLSPSTPPLVAATIAAPEVMIPILTAQMAKSGSTKLAEGLVDLQQGRDSEAVVKLGEAGTELGFAAAPALHPSLFAGKPSPEARALAPRTIAAAERTFVAPKPTEIIPEPTAPVAAEAVKPTEAAAPVEAIKPAVSAEAAAPSVEEIEPFGPVRQFRVTKEFVNPADEGTYKVGDVITEPQLTKAGLPVPEAAPSPEATAAAPSPEVSMAVADEAAALTPAKLTPEELSAMQPEGGAAGASLSGPPLAPAPTPAPAPVLTPKGQRQIITDLAKGLNLPIRFGRLQTTRFGGYFLKLQDLIGVRKAVDVPIVSHEVGHKLDAEFSFSADPALRAELHNLGDPAIAGSRSSWTPSKSATYRIGEGVAEFTRLWLTDPPLATSRAPGMEARFNTILDANKDFGDTMRQARDDIQKWRNAEPQARLRSHISVGSNPNKTRYTGSQLMRDLVDDLHFMRLAVDDAQSNLGSELPPSKNPYLLARNLRGSYGMAETFLRTGVTDFATKEVTPGTSLQDALRPVAGRLDDFRDWIVAKQAQEMHAQGKTTGLVPSDVDIVANRFNADPAFNEAFTKIKAWNDALLKYATDSGLITPESAAAMREMNQDYVPFHRVFEVGAGEPPSSEAAGLGRGLNVGTPGSMRARKGSGREIVDPLETMIRNAYVTITASEKAAINRAVADFANVPKMGKWIEHIATPKDQVRVGIDKVREQLEAAGADLTNVPDDLLMTFYQNSRQAPYGQNIIRLVKDGKPEFYRLKRELFDTFHALDVEDSGTLVRMMSAPAQILRAGVTVAPDFALANAFRDTFTAAIISKYGSFPFEVTLRGIGALLNDHKMVSEWAASGGKQAVESAYFDRDKLQEFLRQHITQDLTPIERMMIVGKSPFVGLRWLSGFFEEATRLGEYKKAYETLSGSGMPGGEARRMAAYEARDRQDFAKGGAKTKIIRRVTAFWNAGLQSNVRLIQAFKERPLRTTLLGLSFITIPKLIEQSLNWNDDDYWDRPQWERDLFFLIPTGKGADGHTRFLKLPTPFEPGVIFGTLPGRFLQWQKQNNPKAVASYPALVAGQGVPNPMPQFAQTLFETLLSGPKGWDVYRGKPIVPERLADLPPDMQWTEQTSLSARHLGSALGFSPLKIDHLINSTTGGFGKQIVHQIIDRAISETTGEERTAKGTVPGGRFITTPATVSSAAIEDFYSTAAQLRAEHLRVTHTGKGEEPEWYRVFENQTAVMGKLRTEISRADKEEDKAELRELILNIARETMRMYRAPAPTP